ncbi:hypothetical protein PROCH_1777 [Prochlorococcus marinus str. EQPAC1]|nr:hypothetical protein PROCH_1777 [Prochlorococcus marinus str. EQPAC1]
MNGENSGRTKLLYVYNEGLGSANKRTSQTLPIERKFRDTMMQNYNN